MNSGRLSQSSTLILLLFISFSPFSCSDNYIESHKIMTGDKSENSVHVGLGVWLEIPRGYSKANSYDGYQLGSNSSISVKISSNSIEKLRDAYDPVNLEKRNIELIELSPVSYGEKENGLFVVMHDKQKNLIRYLLAIHENGKTYMVKAFTLKDTYKQKIYDCLKSVYIGEHIEKEEPFKLAKLLTLEDMILTRDGKYPTESADGSVIEFNTIESLDGVLETGLVKSELQKLTGGEAISVRAERVSNGGYYSGTSIRGDKKAYVALLKIENQGGTLIKCYGNKDCNLDDFDRFLRNKLLKTTIGGR